ncbi:MAG TPA: hypothetical protein VI912_03295 [Candidatus Bilamarchaeaceae archaeon]|nr:hypothetical protein [Candidatus Bilamarchaeaceae archaeon]
MGIEVIDVLFKEKAIRTFQEYCSTYVDKGSIRSNFTYDKSDNSYSSCRNRCRYG